MARLLLTASGTLGDHLPLIGLGRRLAERGHTVTMAVNPAMVPRVEGAGLGAVAVGAALGAQEAAAAASCWDAWSGDRPRRDLQAPSVVEAAHRQVEELGALVRGLGVEVYVAPVNDFCGALVHALTEVPWVSVALMPACFLDPTAIPPTEAARAGQRDEEALDQRLRQRLHLPPAGFANRRARLAPSTLLAASPAFYTPPPAHHPGIETTGFWLVEPPEWSSWTPPPELARFLAAGPPPVALTFSSLPLVDPRAVLGIHARAMHLAGQRLLVLDGWAGFRRDQLPADLPTDGILVTEAVPHSWLFPRVAAVVTHGGIGTLARALACGRPVLVEPWGNDQPFNALRVRELGLGAAVHPHRITAHGLARILTTRVLSSTVQARVEAFAAGLGREAGLDAAVAAIERVAG